MDQNQLIEQLISGKLSFFDFSTLMDNSETVRRLKIIFGRKNCHAKPANRSAD